ncbi:hypothetical protein DPMN_036039 [Dreissena polymorpha]|uniref:Uncharacterized protein n=1 Tax=Dreissena polymorpha TaxID=45954 RepID=A0A9D4MCY4_DREPO|nr:hypothetical protein DPMN_036039 [Dreissena polymorpha]
MFYSKANLTRHRCAAHNESIRVRAPRPRSMSAFRIRTRGAKFSWTDNGLKKDDTDCQEDDEFMTGQEDATKVMKIAGMKTSEAI